MSFVPAEWSEQKAVWFTWPGMESWWEGSRVESLGAFANLAANLSRRVLTRINCAPYAIEDAIKHINKASGDLSNIEFFEFETNDVWCRDSGAIFKIGATSLESIDFKYNSWGGKFPPWDKDDALASKMAKAAGATSERIENFICEGGALEFSADRVLMTTDCVILNPNRNKCSPTEAEEILKNATGAKKIIRLADGLFNDDTDGHIDNLARFTPTGAILAAVAKSDNPSHKQLSENFARLRIESDASQKPYEVVELPLPDDFVKIDKKIAPASYANYLVTNATVFVPTFGQKRSDDRACSIIADMFSGRQIVPIDSRIFLMEGGTIHCLTQQEPLWKRNLI